MSTLFADSLELVDALRVWDIMLCLDARYPVFLAVSFLQQARSSLLKVRDTFAGLQALNLVKDSETSFARIADCAR